MTETKLIIDNDYQSYRRKHFMFLRLQELVHQDKYDHDKALKMFKLITDDTGRKHKIPIQDRRQADIELRAEFEEGDWKDEAKDLHPDRYQRVFHGWHTISFTTKDNKKTTQETLKQTLPNLKATRFRKDPKSKHLYKVQVKYGVGGRQTPRRVISR